MYIAACEKSADRSTVPETPRKNLRMHHLSYRTLYTSQYPAPAQYHK